MTEVRIGVGAGYAGDRVPPAVDMARHGDVDYLVFECLAERTLMMAQLRLLAGGIGYDPLLTDRIAGVLPYTLGPDAPKRRRIVSNMGAADPRGAQQAALRVIREQGVEGVTVAAVEGDDVLDIVRRENAELIETGQRVGDLGGDAISANVYLGVDALLPALEQEADVVLVGRAADPSLFLAPLVFELGWPLDDWERLGAGTAAGHLLECAALSTGGYFADPGKKEISGISSIGFPIAEVDDRGAAVITKPPGTGGAVTVMTCREQMLYEIHDPASYLTPDVTADFSRATLEQVGEDRVVVGGIRGRSRPTTLKVVVGVRGGYIGEGEISYAGPGALGRARLAGEVVRARLVDRYGWSDEDIRTDIIGHDALMGEAGPQPAAEPREVRLRVAARAPTEAAAALVGGEVEPLYGRGPAGGGGVRSSVRAVMNAHTTFIEREAVHVRTNVERS